MPSESVGVLASIGSAGTIWFLVAGGDLLARLGAVRILQLGRWSEPWGSRSPYRVAGGRLSPPRS